MLGYSLKFFLVFVCLLNLEKLPATNLSISSYVNYASQIINSFVKDMEKEFNLHCIGSGGQMPYDVEEIEIGFVTHKQVNIEQARSLEITVTQKLVDKVNSHEKIQPYLRERPFPRQRAKIFIAFEKKDGSYFSKEFVSFVTQAKNCISYLARDSTTDKYLPLYKESWDEAVKALEESQAIQK